MLEINEKIITKNKFIRLTNAQNFYTCWFIIIIIKSRSYNQTHSIAFIHLTNARSYYSYWVKKKKKIKLRTKIILTVLNMLNILNIKKYYSCWFTVKKTNNWNPNNDVHESTKLLFLLNHAKWNS